MKFYFIPQNMKKGRVMGFNEFWENFNFYATEYKIGDGQTNVWKIPNVSWTGVEFSPCKGQTWVDSVFPLSEREIILENGICFNDKDPIPIYGGESWVKSGKLLVHLFPCQPNRHTTCLPSIFFRVIKNRKPTIATYRATGNYENLWAQYPQ